ncbi:MAG TPA: hypothetical protein PKN75_03965 [Bacteroidia bacterium]|nr:hypothetical protein [Bacteroidia bacterium]HNU32726.1 hypothetical protein [Bacteroidia bacterium]
MQSEESRLHLLLSALEVREIKSFLLFLQWQVAINERHKGSLSLMNKIVSQYLEQKTIVDIANKIPAKERGYITGDLSAYLQTFLVFKHAYNSDAVYRHLLSKEFLRRGLTKPFNTLYKETQRKKQDTLQHENGNHYLYELEKRFAEIQVQSNGKAIPGFKNISLLLDTHFVLHKLKLFCEAANYSNILSAEFDLLFRKEIIAIVESGYFNDVKPVMVYYHVLMTLTKPQEEKHFSELQKLVAEAGNNFDSLELMELYHYLKNYCTRKINTGNLLYRKKLLKIYKGMLAEKNLFRKQWLSQWDYKNAVTVSLREKEYSWTKDFIENYNGHLVATERKNAYRFNMAAFHFAKGEYKEAKRMLQFVDLNNVFYRLDARLMMLKIYFELDDMDGLHFQIASFNKFLYRNNQLSDYQKSIYSNLLKAVNKLTQAFNNRAQLKKLVTEFNDAKDIADVQWLKEKANELI